MARYLAFRTGINLKDIRKELGITSLDASVAVHMDQRTWRKWENNEALPEAFWHLFCLTQGLKYVPQELPEEKKEEEAKRQLRAIKRQTKKSKKELPTEKFALLNTGIFE